MTAETAWAQLNEALEDVSPPCSGSPLFVADSRTADERAENYQAAFPSTAGSAEALAHIDEMTTGGAYNLSNGITFAAPE